MKDFLFISALVIACVIIFELVIQGIRRSIQAKKTTDNAQSLEKTQESIAEIKKENAKAVENIQAAGWERLNELEKNIRNNR